MSDAHSFTLYVAVAFVLWVGVLVKHAEHWDTGHALAVLLWPLTMPVCAIIGAVRAVHWLARMAANLVRLLLRGRAA